MTENAAAIGPTGDARPAGEVLLRARGRGVELGLRRLWEYRELLYFFIWRDVKIRYKQTVLGVAWAVLQPFVLMIAFSLFFGRLAKIPSEGIPYPVFYYTALVPWTYFATAVNQSTNSLVNSQALITKVYFPRSILPISSSLNGVVDLAIALVILAGMVVYYGIAPSIGLVLLPAFVALAVATAIGAGLWLSAFNARFRDVRYAVPFLVQFWLFASPVAYPTSLVPERWRTLYALNPMAGVIEGFRWAIAGHGRPPSNMIFVSAAVVVVVLLGGLAYFRRVEGTLIDTI